MENPKRRKIYALQFHPEVTHTENGKEFLRQFLVEIAGITPDWDMAHVLDEQVEQIREQVGPDGSTSSARFRAAWIRRWRQPSCIARWVIGCTACSSITVCFASRSRSA